LSWAYLLLAGLFEIGWPLGFKLSQQPAYRISGIVLAVISMAISGYLLWLAQREIPIALSLLKFPTTIQFVSYSRLYSKSAQY
jgi:multidrug transporter EmrE-like cation transporter